MKKILLGLIAIIFVTGFWVSGTYNGLVTMEEKIDEAWGQVQVQYQRRYDLIPNLVETVKGVANFEKETYQAVTEARSAWADSMKTSDRPAQIEATQNVESALARLLVTVENYPNLKAQVNFGTLQAQIEGTENRVSVARKDYNERITPFNTKVRRFPALLIAGLLGFDELDFFGSDEGADSAPAVNFDN
jgi:LemA protein